MKRISEMQVPAALRRAINRVRLTTIVASADPVDDTFVMRNNSGSLYGRCPAGAFTVTPRRIIHCIK